MTVNELIAALSALPEDVRQRPAMLYTTEADEYDEYNVYDEIISVHVDDHEVSYKSAATHKMAFLGR